MNHHIQSSFTDELLKLARGGIISKVIKGVKRDPELAMIWGVPAAIAGGVAAKSVYDKVTDPLIVWTPEAKDEHDLLKKDPSHKSNPFPDVSREKQDKFIERWARGMRKNKNLRVIRMTQDRTKLYGPDADRHEIAKTLEAMGE